jgi:hypothetical protein
MPLRKQRTKRRVDSSTTIFKLLSSEDQALLVWRNTLIVLDLSLVVVDCVRRLNLQSDGRARAGDKNLHAFTKTMDKVYKAVRWGYREVFAISIEAEG